MIEDATEKEVDLMRDYELEQARAKLLDSLFKQSKKEFTE